MASNIIIAGAGLGGLSLAIACLQRGIKVTVLEQSPHLGEIGAGITLSPNATKAYESLGLREGLTEFATKVDRQGVCDLTSGRILVENNRGDAPMRLYGAHYYQMPRSDLHRLMTIRLTELDPDAVLLGERFIDFEDSGSGVTVRTASGTSLEGAALVGADGIHSRVRACLFGAEDARFTGHVAWRAVIPASRLAGALPVSSGMAIAHRKSLAWYYMSGGTRINIVPSVQTDAWTSEGWMTPADLAEVKSHFAEAAPIFRDLLDAVHPGECFKWGLFDRDPLERWSVARVTLLGDACHPMLPSMGQGAAMAAEDAVILARCLDAEKDPAAAFKLYETLRAPRTRQVQMEARAKSLRVEGPNPTAYNKSQHRNEETIGLFTYDAANEPLIAEPAPA